MKIILPPGDLPVDIVSVVRPGPEYGAALVLKSGTEITFWFDDTDKKVAARVFEKMAIVLRGTS